MLAASFWFCIVAATYSYFWYPGILRVLPSRRNPKPPRQPEIRRVAVVIAARNEATKIQSKLENTLVLETAGVHVEVLVASDASDDTTDSLVRTYEDRGVRLVRSDRRRGKEHAQGLAVAASDADIIVFTDAGTILPKDALTHVLNAFGDPTVGAVSSIDHFLSADGSVQGEGAYVKYEMWLRDLETRFFSLVGLSGSFFAARRSICQNWDDRIPSDFGTALNCARLGMRAVSDRRVIGLYKNIANPRKEYPRKVRTITRGMTALRARKDVLNFVHYGWFSFEVFSHKVMRWATPWFLLTAFGISAALALRSPIYALLTVAQAAFYATPLACRPLPGLLKLGPVRLSLYFVEVNAAILHATFLTLSGRTILVWEPSKR